MYYSESNTVSASVYNNSSVVGGGGIFINRSLWSEIRGNIYNNSSITNGGGGGIFVEYSTDVSILNSYITNNWASITNSVITIRNSAINLMISNCYIGGNNNTSSIGIVNDSDDIINYTIVDNKFITNRLRYLYWGVSSGILITNNAYWTNINNPSLLDTTSGSINNTVINL